MHGVILIGVNCALPARYRKHGHFQVNVTSICEYVVRDFLLATRISNEGYFTGYVTVNLAVAH